MSDTSTLSETVIALLPLIIEMFVIVAIVDRILLAWSSRHGFWNKRGEK